MSVPKTSGTPASGSIRDGLSNAPDGTLWRKFVAITIYILHVLRAFDYIGPMSCHSRGLAVGGHDDCFLIVDRVGPDFVVDVRAHTGEVSTVYLMDVDIEKLVNFLSQKRD